MRPRRSVALTAIFSLVGGAILLLTGPAGAGRPLLSMSLDKTQVEAGEIITVTPDPENECPTGQGGVELFWELYDGQANLEDGGTVPVDEAGGWELELDTAGLAVGGYVLEASCIAEPNVERQARAGRSAAGVFTLADYEPEEFEVIEGEEPPPPPAPDEFDVTSDKASGPAGTTVQLTGINCSPGSGSSVAVKLMPAGPVPAFDPSDEDIENYQVTGPDASFTGPFVVPTGTAAGTYQFVAWCLGEGGQPLPDTEPQVLGFTVTAAAVPVPGQPTFTG